MPARNAVASSGRWDGLLCALAVLIAAFASNPFLEMGLIDDFSYVKTAWVFAQTGRFVYNGWATAMLGWQILWGAFFVRIFGCHFWPLHLSNVVLLALCMLLLHATLVRSGLRRSHAVLGTLALGLSPTVMPLAVSFMTDVGGLLAIVLCWYACLRALDAKSDRAVWLWLIFASLAGTIGGTSRQIAWISALMMVPSAGWLLRGRRGVIGLTVVLWLASITTILASLFWFRHQLFNVPEPIIPPTHLGLSVLGTFPVTVLLTLLCAGMLLLPLFIAFLHSPSRWQAKRILQVVIAAAIATAALHVVAHRTQERGWMPWIGDVAGRLGIVNYPAVGLISFQPMLFTTLGRIIGSFLILGILIAAISVLLRSSSNERVEPRDDIRSWRTQIILLTPFLLGYLCLLLPRSLWFGLLDRYLLPLIPIAALVLLKLHQERISLRIPSGSWAMLALMGCFSAFSTHDWVEAHHARLDAMARLNAAGITDDRASAGWEYDAMTQITLGRTIIDSRVTYPPSEGIITNLEIPADLPHGCEKMLNSQTPMVHPHYFLGYKPAPCLIPTSFAPVPYRTWLPPFRHEILILQRP